MERTTDGEQSKFFFKMNRFVSQNGEWFYMTREGSERGPFGSRGDAEGDLATYIRHMNHMVAFGQ